MGTGAAGGASKPHDSHSFQRRAPRARARSAYAPARAPHRRGRPIAAGLAAGCTSHPAPATGAPRPGRRRRRHAPGRLRLLPGRPLGRRAAKDYVGDRTASAAATASRSSRAGNALWRGAPAPAPRRGGRRHTGSASRGHPDAPTPTRRVLTSPTWSRPTAGASSPSPGRPAGRRPGDPEGHRHAGPRHRQAGSGPLGRCGSAAVRRPGAGAGGRVLLGRTGHRRPRTPRHPAAQREDQRPATDPGGPLRDAAGPQPVPDRRGPRRRAPGRRHRTRRGDLGTPDQLPVPGEGHRRAARPAANKRIIDNAGINAWLPRYEVTTDGRTTHRADRLRPDEPPSDILRHGDGQRAQLRPGRGRAR